jgi:hypothetical protein
MAKKIFFVVFILNKVVEGDILCSFKDFLEGGVEGIKSDSWLYLRENVSCWIYFLLLWDWYC